ncbi:capsular exopolysaccharide biosynthesis protein [Burkholderiales bacterium JOSHI_001]|nr:capsular exopolysaccharide biosynthesis protein [Burkholderiales bacterium JOSHI_001]
MTSLIEQAAQRLEQLRQSGIGLPERASGETQALAPTGHSPIGRVSTTSPMPLDTGSRTSVPVSRQVLLDLTALAASGVVTPQSPRSVAADQFRVIKRPLLTNAKRKGISAMAHGNLIMVTSALVGEGKSFTALNLAMSMAMERDNTVMLVDADVARPSVMRMLGLPPAPGLLELLEGKAEMQDVLLRTNVDKLTILPSGSPHPQATELLASDAMRQLLDDMSRRYSDRIIIFDSPPLLLTTESRVLASQMGQVVLVVQADKTGQADVLHAHSMIKSCPNINLVLNKVSGDGSGDYDRSFGYGYGYGQDAGAGDERS